MPYLANKTMNLFGVIYERGTSIPEKVFLDIPVDRQGALIRTRLVLEIEAAPGASCSICGEGPFARLAQHLSLKHPDLGLELGFESGPNSEEE
jgi:hypothetical protein